MIAYFQENTYPELMRRINQWVSEATGIGNGIEITNLYFVGEKIKIEVIVLFRYL